MDCCKRNVCRCNNRCDGFTEGSFYSLFMSLGDPCKGTLQMPIEQAMEFVENVCARYFTNGYTILNGMGANRGDSSHVEPSVYIMAIQAAERCVFQVAEILRRQFNQSEILIEKNQTRYLYFQG